MKPSVSGRKSLQVSSDLALEVALHAENSRTSSSIFVYALERIIDVTLPNDY